MKEKAHLIRSFGNLGRTAPECTVSFYEISVSGCIANGFGELFCVQAAPHQTLAPMTNYNMIIEPIDLSPLL